MKQNQSPQIHKNFEDPKMDDLRCKSYNDSRRQIESYSYSTDFGNGYSETSSNPTGFRCYSASYASNNTQMELSKEVKFKKGKSSNGSVSKSWSFNDPELQRKKRVASYKVYTVEGKVKGSIKKSFRWIKERCTKVVYGWT
ncbi:uncharacterized protein LOC129893388 [Solanum dulcamara]|uniref:uncharacterized protein LOC129893388 n=1 Tax=Solanum dulcamara TaxID=45834 RepID=UPI0024858306|nr:uncharacterized protein LOC129893388 [Solanum dulcamara]XP_055824878.1 uncharacterized protein LOC129893388 [Solanum dulcamara]